MSIYTSADNLLVQVGAGRVSSLSRTILFIKNIIRILFNIIRYYLTGIIVKKMVLLLKTARAGHPPLGPTAPRRPITALTGCPPPRAPLGDVPGAKGSPISQSFPDSARFTKITPQHEIIF